MKPVFLWVGIILFGFSAQAQTIGGSECGLIDFADDFELSPSVTLTLSEKTRLTVLQQKQILAASSPEATSAKEALLWLIEISEAGDVYYESGKFQGQSYQVVRYYPGGNPYGTIFRKGESTPLAEIQDSDLVCK